jgi:predicted unusual protein kinase regulating ubiquinone biosynthesis (AarF/ABC1/UbiB family)
VVDGFFHADLHHGNLFALPTADWRDRFRDHGPDRPTRAHVAAEILYGLITGNYRCVAEIHFRRSTFRRTTMWKNSRLRARRGRADPRPAGQGHLHRLS